MLPSGGIFLIGSQKAEDSKADVKDVDGVVAAHDKVVQDSRTSEHKNDKTSKRGGSETKEFHAKKDESSKPHRVL
jgi:hypothetical protein